MLGVITVVYLLLSIFAGSTTAQEDPLCTKSYAEFESASVASNISGRHIRNQLYNAFYAPNQPLPYSVLVTYQLVLTNGTRVNLSSDSDCSRELWAWLSSPTLMVGDTTYLNRLLLFTLNYFSEWHPPHVTITTTTAPCPDKIKDFLSEMTASLQDYALGRMEDKTQLGYVKRGCGTSTFNTVFSPVGRGRDLILTIGIMSLIGNFFQIVFVWIVSAVILNMMFKEYAQKTFTYSYDVYGTFWGISTAALVLLVVLYGFSALTGAYLKSLYSANKNTSDYLGFYILFSCLLFTLVMELPVALYTARKAAVAVPFIFKYPATLLCCGRKRRAECFVTTLALWVDLVTLQLVLLQGYIAAFVLSAAPFAIVTHVLLVVLAFTCLASIFSLLFTIFAHLCTPADQRVHSSSMVLRAVVVLPLLLMIMCYDVVLATMGSITNIDARKDNILSFINSIATPILLGLVIIFLKRFISAWLKWDHFNQADTGQETNSFRIQDVDEELLDP